MDFHIIITDKKTEETLTEADTNCLFYAYNVSDEGGEAAGHAIRCKGMIMAATLLTAAENVLETVAKMNKRERRVFNKFYRKMLFRHFFTRYYTRKETP